MQFSFALASTDQVYRRIIAGRKAMILTLRRVADLGDLKNSGVRGEREVQVSCLAVELLHSTMDYLLVGSCEAPGFGIPVRYCRKLVKFNGRHSGGG